MRTRILNNTFNMHDHQSWSPDGKKKIENFNIEFFGGHDSEVLISGNRFDQTISILVADKSTLKGPYRFKIQGNYFKLVNGYAVELGSSGMHIENNYFQMGEGSAYAVLRNFNGQNGPTLKDIRVSGNVADGGQFSFFHSSNPLDGLKLYNNTVVFRQVGMWRNSQSSFHSGQRSAADLIVNNLVVNFKTLPVLGLANTKPNMNIHITAANAREASHILRRPGVATEVPTVTRLRLLNHFYALGLTSPAANMGVKVDRPFLGTAPDIGAIETR
jgi:hypothetical protein